MFAQLILSMWRSEYAVLLCNLLNSLFAGEKTLIALDGKSELGFEALKKAGEGGVC